MSERSNIEETIKKATSYLAFLVHKGDYDELKQAALIFLNLVNKISELNREIMSKETIRGEINEIYRRMRLAEKNTQRALLLQHIFLSQLNSFMGRTIYLTYVNKLGNLYIYDDADVGKLYSEANANKGRGNIVASKMFDVFNVQEDLREKLLISIQNRKAVYQLAVSRWEGNYQLDFDPTKTETGKAYYPSKNTFYWRLYDYHITGWTRPIQNRGWIAEGYAGAVINENKDVNSRFMESSLKALWEEMNQNSIGGAIKGDIVLDRNLNIQFAIKSGSFSTAKFGQYVRLAYNISQMKTLTPQQFETVLPKLVNFGKITDQIIKAANTIGEKELIFKVGKEKYTVILGL